MPLRPLDLTAIAAVNLHYALAEVTIIENRDAITRALDHVRQAEHTLSVLLAEYEDGQDAEEAA